MDEFILEKPYADTRLVDGATHENPQAFRVYRNQPDSIAFQIRTKAGGKIRISNVGLTFAEVHDLIASLEKELIRAEA